MHVSQHTFCWARYDGPKGIRSLGNDAHNRACPWHSDKPALGPTVPEPSFCIWRAAGVRCLAF